MSKIKVIKKNAVKEFDRPVNTPEAEPKSKQREMVETIENWVADWRRRTEVRTRLASGELTRLRLKDSVGV
jgi:hypothetical protein